MATWLEKLRNIDQRNKEQEKIAREMTHRPQAPIESLRGQDPLTDWGLGVRERTLNPLAALAGESKRFQGLSPQEMGMELVGGGIAGTFIGKGAKTWKSAMKDTAEKLEKQGVSPEEIWKQTGTFRGADKEWRQEIPDNLATFKKGGIEKMYQYGYRPQEQIFAHDELYKAYPEAGKISTTYTSGDIADVAGKYGAHYAPDNTISLGVPRKNIDLPRASSINLHELQHAIQQREGWARGGAPEQFEDVIKLWQTSGNEAKLNKLESIDENLLSGKEKMELVNLQIARDKVINSIKNNDTPQGQYNRLAGEAEARLTQSRMKMTPEQRAASYPPSMFDVPMENQIVRLGDLAGDSRAMSVAPKTQYELAHELAQRNAALPIEQGGLGLPVNNTAMDRAKAMEFDTPAYHTSRTGIDTDVLDSGKFAIAPFDAIGTHFGTKDAARDRFNRTVGTTEQIKGSTYPVLLNSSNPYLDDLGKIYTEDPLSNALSIKSDYGDLQKSNALLRNQIFKDHTIIPYINDVEAAGSISYIADPQNIRSRFAAFDPFQRNSANILAGTALGGVGLSTLAGNQDEYY